MLLFFDGVPDWQDNMQVDIKKAKNNFMFRIVLFELEECNKLQPTKKYLRWQDIH